MRIGGNIILFVLHLYVFPYQSETQENLTVMLSNTCGSQLERKNSTLRSSGKVSQSLKFFEIITEIYLYIKTRKIVFLKKDNSLDKLEYFNCSLKST